MFIFFSSLHRELEERWGEFCDTMCDLWYHVTVVCDMVKCDVKQMLLKDINQWFLSVPVIKPPWHFWYALSPP